ncbi:MAG: hypothetical protein ABSE16_04345 [Verrucomicrobiota bacterium]|jgi:hypothetical protein
MKTNTLIGSAALMAGLLVASSAQATVTLTFDENGNTSGYISGTTGYLSDGVQSDNEPEGVLNGYQIPVASGVGGSTLDYLGLYSAFGGGYPQLGWVAIYAYGTPNSDYGTTTGLLDLIHFDNSIAYNGKLYDQMFWYSTEGSGNLADHMPPSSVISAVLAYHYLTSVTENANGLASYTPPGEYNAGYNYGGTTQYTYDFQSAVIPVPEASTIIAGTLLVLPFGASALRILRRNRIA